MRTRLLSIIAALTVALALPAAALAAGHTGTVLSLSRSQHLVQVIDSQHQVHAYRFRTLPALHRGSRIDFQAQGQSISHVKSLGSVSSVTFYAKVLSAGKSGLALRLGDGQKLTLSAKQLRHAKAKAKLAPKGSKTGKVVKAHIAAVAETSASGNVTINIQGLQPGETVLITEATDTSGNITITIQLTGSSGGGTVQEHQQSGVVSDVEDDTFVITISGNSAFRFHMAAAALANLDLNVCDQVTVSYHEDAGMLIADNVTDSGPSTTGACAEGGDTNDVIGTITNVSATSITIDAGDQGTMTFTVSDPSITAGFQLGDSVDVTYEQAADGSLVADDVEYNDNQTSGVVSALTQNTITMVDDNTGQTETFNADPSLLDDVAVGDDVDVSYYQAADGLTLDQLSDNGPAGGSGGGSSSDNDAIGTITNVSATSITIDAGDQGTMTFTVPDPSITAGFLIGDSVDVTYEQASDGSLVADDVEYN